MLRRSRSLRRLLIAGVVATAATSAPGAQASPPPLTIQGSLTVNEGVAAYEVTNLATSQAHATSIDLRSPERISALTASSGECFAEGERGVCLLDLAPGQTVTIYGHSSGYAAGARHDVCAQSTEPQGEACLTLTAAPLHPQEPAPVPTDEPLPPATPPQQTPPPQTPPQDTPPQGTAPAPLVTSDSPPKTVRPVTSDALVTADPPGTDCHCVDLFARITRTDPVGHSRGRGVIGFDVNWRMRCSGGARFRTCKGKLKLSLPDYPNATTTIAPYARKRVRKPIYRTKNGIRQKDARGHFIIDGWRVVVEDVKGRAAATQEVSCATTCGGTVTGKSFVRVVIPRLGPANADGSRAIKVKIARDCPGTPLADQDLELVFNSWGDLQKKLSTLS